MKSHDGLMCSSSLGSRALDGLPIPQALLACRFGPSDLGFTIGGVSEIRVDQWREHTAVEGCSEIATSAKDARVAQVAPSGHRDKSPRSSSEPIAS